MPKQRILYVSTEIAPYLPDAENSRLGRSLPQAMQERKYEVRTFMPNFGAVNERRNQLHEVIRLSGINIMINDNDHPLIIKVASMQPSRIQVYFIDNDDYFQKSEDDIDPIGTNREDNDERMIFYARGTVETAKKLRWEPEIVHVSGWMAALVPLFLRRIVSDGTSFKNSKTVYSVLRDENTLETVDPEFFEKLKADCVKEDDLKDFVDLPNDVNLLHRLAIAKSDGVVFNTPDPDPTLIKAVEDKGIPYMILDPEQDNAQKYHEFYQSLINA